MTPKQLFVKDFQLHASNKKATDEWESPWGDNYPAGFNDRDAELLGII